MPCSTRSLYQTITPHMCDSGQTGLSSYHGYPLTGSSTCHYNKSIYRLLSYVWGLLDPLEPSCARLPLGRTILAPENSCRRCFLLAGLSTRGLCTSLIASLICISWTNVGATNSIPAVTFSCVNPSVRLGVTPSVSTRFRSGSKRN
jgi:hypothetical protein